MLPGPQWLSIQSAFSTLQKQNPYTNTNNGTTHYVGDLIKCTHKTYNHSATTFLLKLFFARLPTGRIARLTNTFHGSNDAVQHTDVLFGSSIVTAQHLVVRPNFTIKWTLQAENETVTE
jgi:hypothetical protein